MAIYLRQICLVAEDLAFAIDKLSAVFSIPNCFVDPAVNKFGLENTLLQVGSQFIEVVAPLKTNPSLDSTAAGRFLKRRGGDGGYMVICQVPSLEEQAQVRERAKQNHVRIAYESDRETWNIMQLHPADMGAAFFEVDWDCQSDMTGNWHPAGGKQWMDTPSTSVISAITAIELQSDDPQSLAQQWANVAGVNVDTIDNTSTLVLANVNLRFIKASDSRGAGLGGLDVKVTNRDQLFKQADQQQVPINDNCLSICGTRFYLV